jgi:hypothetical protein
MTLHLDRLLPLPEAASRLSEVKLRAMSEKGKIKAGIPASGEIVVSKNSGPEHLNVLEPGQRGRGSRMYLDEADVAYCACVQALRQRARVYAGAPLLDDEGRPYLLKHPKLSQVRRQRRGA